MFLKEVYRHSKWMFAGMVLFAVCQITINLKRGMVFSPFYHYGMYSGVFHPRKEYFVNIITVKGDTLRGKDFSPAAWDKIHYTLQQIHASRCDTLFFKNEVERLFIKAGLPPPPLHLFVNEGTMNQRLDKLKSKLAAEFKVKPNEVVIKQCSYSFLNDKLVFKKDNQDFKASNHLCP